jgi:hypothetical protein
MGRWFLWCVCKREASVESERENRRKKSALALRASANLPNPRSHLYARPLEDYELRRSIQ